MEAIEYKVNKIINIHKHTDGGYFWDKYSAHPYVGCQHRCEFCYEIGTKYNPAKTPEEFGETIKVKINSPELLRKELARLPKDVLLTCDYQPVDTKYKLSRQFLEICLETEFPVLIVERSPLVLRDLDLLTKINKKSWACVVFSMSYAVSEGYRKIFEPHAPPVEQRFEAMREISAVGIPTGTAFMPILPFISDSEENIESVVQQTQAHGGSFVIGGGLSLNFSQKERYIQLIKQNFPHLMERYDHYFNADEEFSKKYNSVVGKRIRKFCNKYGISDRMPRYIPDNELEINKKVAEKLFLSVYESELNCDNAYKIWAYRKAAWILDELPESIEVIFRKKGIEGIAAIEGIGKSVANKISTILTEILNK